MTKPSKEEFDLVIKAIRYEYRNKPINLETPTILGMAESFASKAKREGVFILLEIAKHPELKNIPQEHIGSVINWLELVDKVLEDRSPRTHFPSGKPFTVPVSILNEPSRFCLKIHDSFDNWYAAYLLKRASGLDNLSQLNLEKIYALVLDIDDKIQVNPSPTITIGVDSINTWKFKLLHGSMLSSFSRLVREFRKDALDYLKTIDVINDYKLDYTEYITITVDITKFQELKAEIVKIYAEKYQKETKESGQHSKKIEPTKLSPEDKWEDITIQFKNGNDVDIKIKDKTFRSDYKAMGFEDKRTRNPDMQWELLIRLSENNGEIDWQSYPQNKNSNARLTEQEFGVEKDKDIKTQNRGFSYKKAPDSTKKAKQLLAKELKAFFGIKEDPFFPYRKEGSYKIKIILIPA